MVPFARPELGRMLRNVCCHVDPNHQPIPQAKGLDSRLRGNDSLIRSMHLMW